MAKHHWSKKAVLASLMLGASVLVSTATQATTPSSSFNVHPAVANQTFDIENTELALLSVKPDNEGRTRQIKTALQNMNTEYLSKLYRGMLYPSEIDASIAYSRTAGSELNKNKAYYDVPLNDLELLEAPDYQTPFYRKQTGLGLLSLTPITGESTPVDPDTKKIFFRGLVEEEIQRRLKSYETAVYNAHDLSSKAKEIQGSLEKTSEEKNKLNTEVKKKTQELVELTEKSKILHIQLQEADKTNENLTSKVKNTEKALKDSKEEIRNLSEQVSEFTKKHNELQSQLESKQKDLTDLQQRFDTATELNQEEKAKLQAELDAKKTEVTNLQAQVAESSEKLQALEEAKKEAEAKVNSLTSEKADIEAKLKDQSQLSEEEKAKLEKQLADIQSKIAEKDASIKSLEGQLDTLKRQEHDTTPSTPEAPQVPEVKPEDKPKAPSTPEVQPVPETKPQAPQTPEAGKPSTPKKPEIKPAPTPAIPEVKPSTPHTPEKPGKAHPAAPKAHHAATPTTPHTATQNTAAQLPQTGDAATNPFFTVAALSIIASAGVLATKRKED
ncbi:LPXTG cell wall anchor domain-containing protein [Streptococcus halichoeri]|uniref:LPXTG cell wall anchor domain-containing protein n=1 Tax=Streptococcus halichoeri TaxID=254785 RepID=UPI001358C634|nr:LPXTG cell wall anchor domain-containing protein [Streptococcus halichoeri]